MSPFRKNNQHPYYINVDSNHPRQVFEHILTCIIFELSTHSSDINIFTQSRHDYKLALKNSGYKTKLVYKTIDETFNVGGRIGLENFHDLRRHIIWL